MRISSLTPPPSTPTDSEPPRSTPPRPRALGRGARGPEVVAVQQRLERAGHVLTRWGVDGRFGAETARALREFQRLQGLPVTGRGDAVTLAALEARAGQPRTPEYGALLADGVLRATLAVGFDESGAHEPEVAKVLQGLVARGYVPVSETERAEFGLAGEANGWVRRPAEGTGAAPVVLELITPDTPDAKARFARGLAGTELVLYGGHGRYGSGPDFDPIDSPEGNFVIGAPTAKGVVTLGPNDLPGTEFTRGYQLLFFSGCSTHRYFDELRTLPEGKTTKTLDLVGSTRELYWKDTAANLFTMLDGVTEGQALDQLLETLDQANRFDPEDERHFFRGDGFQDNP
jgi:hypothetical protein